MASETRLIDGQLDWSGGVDSGRVPTEASTENPNGLGPNMLAWMNNASCRGGGVRCRTGWKQAFASFVADTGLFQGGFMYEPDGANPYIIFSVSGRTFKINLDAAAVITEITNGNLNPATLTQSFFVQAEQFLIIQAGDFTTVPLVWDGVTLRRITAMGGVGPYLPPGRAMEYFMGRVWVQTGERTYMAGDIVSGPSGTATYALVDSLLHSLENTFFSGGGSFRLPNNSGSIRCIRATGNINTATGQGTLFIFTRKMIFAMDPPVDRAKWQAVTADTLPLQRIVQQRFGTFAERSVVALNSDLFYQAVDGVRSLRLAIRDYSQWPQTPLSRNENRILQYNDRSLMRFATGMVFDNRLWQSSLPIQTPVGVAFQAVMPLDFDVLSSFEQKLPPAWEGMYEGLNFLQLLEGDFGGLQRGFSFVHSRLTGKIELWEMTDAEKFDNGDNRVTWIIETPAYTWKAPFEFKQLDNAEFWFDKIFGTVDIKFYFRPDQSPCWTFWHEKQICASRSCKEDVPSTCAYIDQLYCEQDRIPVVLPIAPGVDCDNGNKRPVNMGYQFQLKIVVKGWCRLRGIKVFAVEKGRVAYQGLDC